MSNLFNMPRVEAQDSSGGVLAGAKLEFFQTGTSTNLDTYSNDSLATANANPVVADSAGRFGAIFMRDEDYKVVLSDSDDVQIWSADPVRGGVDNLADDTIRSTLATTGSANAYLLTINRTLTAYANGDVFIAKANFGCTGAATLNVTGGQSGASALGAKTIKKKHDQDLASGDTEDGQWLILKYDGTNMQLLSPVASASYTDPITTRGDLIRGDASGNVERVAVGTSGQVMQSDGTDAAWGAVPTATDTLVGGAETATQNEQETGTATDKMVTSGRQKFHPSAVKAWLYAEGDAADVDASKVSYNIGTITDNGVGSYTIPFTTNQSTATYAVATNGGTESTGTDSDTIFCSGVSLAVGSFRLDCEDTSGVNKDVGEFGVIVVGDL